MGDSAKDSETTTGLGVAIDTSDNPKKRKLDETTTEDATEGTSTSNSNTIDAAASRIADLKTGTFARNDRDIEREFELPLACVNRILRKRIPEKVSVTKEAKMAIAKSAGIFILYLTAAANEYCRDGKRQTLSARDILDGLATIQFGEFVPPLEECLNEMRKDVMSKKKQKKQKTEHSEPAESSTKEEEAEVKA